MGGGVPVGRVVAAADVAAFEADPEVEPGGADPEAVDAPVDRLGKLGHEDLVEMGAGRHRGLRFRIG
jgi:hypothetical protein